MTSLSVPGCPGLGPDNPPRQPIATRYEFADPRSFVGSPMDTAHLHDPFVITVEWRGGDTWAVLRGHGWSPQRVWCESAGEWEYEPQPSSRDDDFLARCRYDLTTALAIGFRLTNEGEAS